jgi:subtilase family serine protease
VSGTSISAPLTAGVAGLVISQGLDRGFNLTNNDVKHILELTAQDVAPTGCDNETGYGIVNAHNALQLLSAPNVVTHGISTGGTATKLQTLSQWILLDNRWGLAAASYGSIE